MNKPKMTSLQAAALLLSGGATEDVETAELMNSGKLLDPDVLERSHFRRMLGFDFSVIPDLEHKKMVILDDERGYRVTCAIYDDVNIQASKLAKACIKLKKLHDAHVEAV